MNRSQRKKQAKAARDSLANAEARLDDARNESAPSVVTEEMFAYLCGAVADLTEAVAQLLEAVESQS